MPMHLRQICLVAERLAPAVDDLAEVLSIRPCFVDPNVGHFGLENTLLAIGSNLLEVVAPTEADTAAGRYLTRRNGDGGYMVICQVESREAQDACRRRAADNNVRVAWEADRKTWRIMQLHPRDMQASFLEVDWDEQSDFEGNWMPAGGLGWKETVADDVTRAIVGVELQGPDPAALAAHWAAVIGNPVEQRQGQPVVPLANATLRFAEATDGRGPGLGGVDLEVADIDRVLAQARARGCRVSGTTVEICGTRFNLMAAA